MEDDRMRTRLARRILTLVVAAVMMVAPAFVLPGGGAGAG
jgi:hypothetical protein